MSRSYISLEGYELYEDDFCTWHLRSYANSGQTVASSLTPWPLIDHAVKQNWFSWREGSEATQLVKKGEL